MILDFPVPNAKCGCGTVLFSWEDVVAHWRRHRDERDGMRKAQEAMGEIMARRG